MTRNIGARPSLNKHEMERLARIQRQSVQKYGAQQERVKHMQEIRRRQRVQDYESEYDNLRAATVHSGPLHVAAVQRLAELKIFLGKDSAAERAEARRLAGEQSAGL
jgi:hypothetical protein